MSSVSLTDVTKTYDHGKVVAVDNVSFEVEEGELFGLIGPDGAGKTSIFRMLATLLIPDKGTVTVHGFDVVKDYQDVRNCIGYMPGRFSLYQDLTVAENLNFFATLFNTTVAENYSLIKEIYDQIKPFSNRRAGKLSGGMKQKLALCCALIHKPEVLLLDEPTTGVDVVSRKEFWDMLKRLKQQGITILVSTPYMDEAKLCGRVALIQSGSLMAIDTPANIISTFPSKLYAAKSANIYQLLNDLRGNNDVSSAYAFGEYLHVTLRHDTDEALPRLRQYAIQKGHHTLDMLEIEPTIEDSFIRLMKKDDRVMNGISLNQ